MFEFQTCKPANLIQPNWIHKSTVMKRNMLNTLRFTIQNVEPINVEVVWHDCLCNGITELKKEEVKKYVNYLYICLFHS